MGIFHRPPTHPCMSMHLFRFASKQIEMLESRAVAEAEARNISAEAAEKEIVAQKLERQMIDSAAEAEADRKVCCLDIAVPLCISPFCPLHVLVFRFLLVSLLHALVFRLRVRRRNRPMRWLPSGQSKPPQRSEKQTATGLNLLQRKSPRDSFGQRSWLSKRKSKWEAHHSQLHSQLRRRVPP